MFASKNWCIYFIFIFYFLYSNSKIKYRKNDSFLHLRVFSKLFWIHGLVLFPIYFLKVTFFFLFTYTHSHQSREVLCIFTIFTKLPLYSFSMKMKTLKKCFHFLYSNSTFRILKMKTEYKFLNQTSFFYDGSHWKWKQKTLLFLINHTGPYEFGSFWNFEPRKKLMP